MTHKDIALDYTGQTGDLDLTGHRLNLSTDTAYVEQHVRVRCRFFFGEWFLDESLGIPYYRNILIKSPDLDLIRSLFRNVVRTTPDISAVNSVDVILDSSNRTLSITIAATMETGHPFEPSPFIVEI
jgi:hypothetical protein